MTSHKTSKYIIIQIYNIKFTFFLDASLNKYIAIQNLSFYKKNYFKPNKKLRKKPLYQLIKKPLKLDLISG